MSEFDSYAHDYDEALNQGIGVSGESKEYFAKARVAWLARCLERMRRAPTTVLDYGCGTGTATPFFFELLGVESVVGVDLSAKSIEVARQTHRDLSVEFRLIDECKPESQVDLAFCNGVFHHVPPSDREAAVKYIADRLRPGGIFALWENNPWSPAARYVMSRIPFDKDAIMLWPSEAQTLVESAQLRAVRTDYCFIFPRSLSVFRSLEPTLKHFPFGAQYQLLSQKPQCD